MTWTRLAFKEWQRRPLRTSLTAMGVALATSALFSLLSFQQGYRQGVRQELDRLGAHVLLVPKGCPYDAASMALHGASWPCYLKQSYLREVNSVPGVATAAPVFMAAVYDTGATQTVYVGVESNILSLKPSWHIQGTFPEHTGELLVGSEVSRHYGWSLGQQVHLPGLPHQSGNVTGILAPTQGAEDTFIHLSLADAQQRFQRPQELTHILVQLSDPNALDQAVRQLRGCDAGLVMNVVPLAHVFHTIQDLMNSTRLLLGCVAVVALLVAGAGVSNTVLMAVAERRRDLGVLRAIGASRADIFRLLSLETLQTCFVGATIGIVGAFFTSGAIEAWVRSKLPFAPTDALIHWEGWSAAACLASAVLVGCFAALFPAWRAASLPPIKAIREAGGRI